MRGPEFTLQMFEASGGTEDEVENALNDDTVQSPNYDYIQNGHHHVKRNGHVLKTTKSTGNKTTNHITQNASFWRAKQLKTFLSKGKIHDD
jgi:hypothetical protein